MAGIRVVEPSRCSSAEPMPKEKPLWILNAVHLAGHPADSTATTLLAALLTTDLTALLTTLLATDLTTPAHTLTGPLATGSTTTGNGTSSA